MLFFKVLVVDIDVVDSEVMILIAAALFYFNIFCNKQFIS